MSNTDRPKYEKLTLPKGKARWIAVNKPLTKFKKEGEYSVDVVLTPEQAKPLIEKFEAMAKEQGQLAAKDEKFMQALKKAKAAAKSKGEPEPKPIKVLPIVPELDADGNPTGNFVARCKQKGQFTRKDGSTQNVVITVVDSKKHPVKANIGKGSEVRVATTIIPFYSAGLLKFGVSLRIEGVQIVTLVEYRGGADVDSMFSNEEGGYDAAESGTSGDDGSSDPSAPAGGGNAAGSAAEADFA